MTKSTKEILRIEAKAIRAGIPEAQRRSDAVKLKDNVIACLNDSSIHVIQNSRVDYTVKPCNDDSFDRVIGTYYPIGTEIIPPFIALPSKAKGDAPDTIAPFSSTGLRDVSVCLPVIRDKTTLEFYPWSPDKRLIKRDFDIPIPDTRGLLPVIPDIILLPLLLCDKYGNRIGYGAGHYDRYIASLNHKPILIGVCFDEQIYDGTIPHEPHDVPLDLIITPNRVIEIT